MTSDAEENVDSDAPALPDTRRPRTLYGAGSEPDARFTMANERTALAWMRSALGLLAGGAGLTSLVQIADLPQVLDGVAALMCLAAAGFAAAAVHGWRERELAMRLGRPMPQPTALWTLAALIFLGALVVAGVVAVSATR